MAAIGGAIAGIAGFFESAGAAVGAALGIGAVAGGFIVNTALSIGLNYVLNALAGAISGRPKAPVAGIRGQLQSGGAVPRTIMMGWYATAGSLVYAGSWGTDGDTPNAYFTQVIALSDFPVSALSEFWCDGKKGTVTGTPVSQGTPVSEFSSGGEDYLWVKFYDGSQTTADSFLTSTFGSDPNYPWASTAVLKGCAYAIVTARLNPQLFTGFPQFKFALNGAKLYDPRLDSTNGGSGSHRFSDQSTWAFTNNPMVMIYNILRGVTYNSKWLYGLQSMVAARVPTADWKTAMDACDNTVTNSASGTEAQFRAGIEISVADSPADVIEALLQACNGRLAEIGGVYKPLAGAVGSSVYSFTDDDIIIDQAQTFDQFPSLNEIINGMQATHPEPTEGWQTKDAPPRFNSTYETADGGRRLVASVDYGAVPYADQVQRLMASAILEHRKFRKHSHALPPPAFKLEPNDVITWTSTRNSYTTKDFLVGQVTIFPNLDIGVSISECDPADYDVPTYIAKTTTTPASPTVPAAPGAPSGLSVSQNGSVVTVKITDTQSAVITGYDYLYGSTGGTISTATYLDRNRRGADFTSNAGQITPGSYKFYVVARDSFDRIQEAARGTAASTTFTVVDTGFGDADLLHIAQGAGLTVPIWCVDSASAASYSGSGSTWTDLGSVGTNLTKAGSPSQPVFHGTAGSLDNTAEFTDGNGGRFENTGASGTLTGLTDGLHPFTIALLFSPSSSSAAWYDSTGGGAGALVQFSIGNAGGTHGLSMQFTNHGVGTGYFGSIKGDANLSTSDLPMPVGSPVLFIWSHDITGTGTDLIFVNGSYVRLDNTTADGNPGFANNTIRFGNAQVISGSNLIGFPNTDAYGAMIFDYSFSTANCFALMQAIDERRMAIS